MPHESSFRKLDRLLWPRATWCAKSVLIAAVIVVTSQVGCDRNEARAIKAEQQQMLEQQRAVEARDQADAARRTADVARAQAERNYALAVGAAGGGIVLGFLGCVIGMALGSKARHDAERTPRRAVTSTSMPAGSTGDVAPEERRIKPIKTLVVRSREELHGR